MKAKYILILGLVAFAGGLSADANQDRRVAENQKAFNQDINRNNQNRVDFQRQVQQNYQNRNVTPPYVPPRPVYNNRR